MAARPVLIAQISDLHITPAGALAYGRVDTAAALTRAIDTINRMSPRPDLVVISGDIANSALPEEYERASSLLGDLQMPFAAIPGNHDRRIPMRRALPDPSYGAAESALNAMRSIGEVDVLLIDSTVPGAAHGELDAATLAWLDSALAASATRPALLFLHHPPFDTGIVYTDAIRLRNADALAALLKRHPRTLLVAAGHVHRAAQTVFAGISATICPAGEQAVLLEFAPRWPEVYKIEPPALHLHAWLPGEGFGSVVTHVVPIGEFPGPYSYGYSDTTPPQL
ncbi:MAG TPA: phosphodiesterase [Pseudolabrys sp.]|nr:phosphodiesterase [Pseudolabrys sp.]